MFVSTPIGSSQGWPNDLNQRVVFFWFKSFFMIFIFWFLKRFLFCFYLYPKCFFEGSFQGIFNVKTGFLPTISHFLRKLHEKTLYISVFTASWWMELKISKISTKLQRIFFLRKTVFFSSKYISFHFVEEGTARKKRY